MKLYKPENFLWVERYRPQSFSDIILPSRIKNVIKPYIDKKQIPHFIFHSINPGTGKTTLAKVIAKELNTSTLFINGSNETGIDVLRTKVEGFCSSKPEIDKNQNMKIVIIDEAERLSPNTQDALKTYLESVSKYVRFIFTVNNKDAIIDPIKSRCQVIDFNYNEQDYEELKKIIFKRLTEILTIEKVEYDKKAVASIIVELFPDLRRMINYLQESSQKGKISEKIVNDKKKIDMLWDLMKECKKSKDIESLRKLRKFVLDNFSYNPMKTFVDIYQKVIEDIEHKSIVLEMITIIANYQFKATSAMDKEICLMACIVELMNQMEG